MVYYDLDTKNYYSYNLSSGLTQNITERLPTKFFTDYPPNVSYPAVAPPVGWVASDMSILIYDNYDLWKIDPANKRPAVNITAGYGIKHGIKLRLADGSDEIGTTVIRSLGDTLLMTGVDMKNRYNGFFRQVLGSTKEPVRCSMGPYTYYVTTSQRPYAATFNDGTKPMKAANRDVWVVMRQSASEAPNYFLTSDFNNFKPLTEFVPQAKWDWLTSELITYKQLDGTSCQEYYTNRKNFDPHKKYPVIFNYYDAAAHRVFQYPAPGLAHANINIPWFVSRGYLVFIPEILFKPANLSNKIAGEWTRNSVVGAAKYLSKLPYVDSHRMGIQGHSFGGEQTNYLLISTNIFAAASEMAGQMDMLRRAARGQMSEVFGDQCLIDDKLMRTVGISHLADAELKNSRKTCVHFSTPIQWA